MGEVNLHGFFKKALGNTCLCLFLTQTQNLLLPKHNQVDLLHKPNQTVTEKLKLLFTKKQDNKQGMLESPESYPCSFILFTSLV